MAKVYTKTGDNGETGLYGGSRVQKDSLQVNAYGSIDKTTVSIGVAKAHIEDEKLKNLLEKCQVKLFDIGALLASDENGRAKLTSKITEEDVLFIEESIDKLNEKLEAHNFFAIPGATVAGSFAHMARVDVRQSERKVIEYSRTQEIPAVNLKYLNRLSDLMFIVARVLDEKAEVNL